MNTDIGRLVSARGGVLHRDDLLAEQPHHLLDRSISGGHLVRVLPRTYVGAGEMTDLALARAVARYADGRGVLSHLTALWLWDLLDAPGRPMHLTVRPNCGLRPTPVLRVHRAYAPPLDDDHHLRRRGLPVVGLERAIVASWPLLAAEPARAVVLRAVRDRRTTPDRLRAEVAATPRLARRASLAAMVELLAAGCQSELELFGLRHVFTGPAFAGMRPQCPVRLGARTAYLDLAAEDLQVGIELDGAAYHDGTGARERDRRRDVALAAAGWVVLRFSYGRVVGDPAGVRHEVASVIAVRRTQLRGDR